jgi:2-methylisocitrate lyase-like PEP mutase family enzyme
VPGAYDCLSARIIERAGFPALLHGGYNSAASMLGLPDIGLATMTEMLYAAKNIAAAVAIPVVCDLDDGFGSLRSTDRAARESMRGGLAGLFVEDQASPRRSPSLGGQDVISASAMATKIRVISMARADEDPDFVVIARTYSARSVDIQEALRRAEAYADAGADAIFVDLAYGPEAIDELRFIARNVPAHCHVVANMSETVGRPLLTSEALQEMGIKIVIYPMTALMAAAHGVDLLMKHLHAEGSTASLVDSLMPLKEVAKLTGIEEAVARERAWVESSSPA